MKHYKYILLDWDGNLAKTLDIWLVACREVLEKRGYFLSDEEIAAGFGQFPRQMRELGIKDYNEAMDEADMIAKRKLPDVELYPDALDVLRYLHQSDKKLALLTSSFHENIGHLLDRYNIRELFDVIVAGDDVNHHKPHPECIEKALAELNGSKDEAVIVGDSDKDLGAAKNAGIDSIWFYPPEHKKFYDKTKLESFDPTYIVEDFRKIKDIIKP